MKTPIFLDNHSTTPVDPRVLDEMLPFFTLRFGNAASRNHSFGWEAEKAVEQARGQVARLIHCDPKEIIFTSGATESNNIALKGIAESYREKGNHLITVVTEHKSILDTMKRIEKGGFDITYLPVDFHGRIDPNAVRAAITPKTILISVMIANNEIGVIQPISEISKIAKEKGVLVHSDAAQAVGKIPVDVQEIGIDLLSLSAHKMYGPKGVGALYLRRGNPRIRVSPLIDGGGHERGIRSGTLNVPGIVGLGKASELCEKEMDAEGVRLSRLRDRLKEIIFGQLDEVYLNGHPKERLPHNLNISILHVEAESLLLAVSEIAISLGSACTTGTVSPSYVLRALGLSHDLAHASIRFGLGRFNTDADLEYAGQRIVEAAKRLRAISPVYDRSSVSSPLEGKG
jgi:cysteine desulfurase